MDALARKYIQRGGRDVLLFLFFFSLSPFSSYREGETVCRGDARWDKLYDCHALEDPSPS